MWAPHRFAVVLAAFGSASAANISPTQLPFGKIGKAYSVTVVPAEARPYVFSAANLPSGLAIDPSTGAISGRVSTPVTAQVAVTVTSGGQTATRTFALTVRESGRVEIFGPDQSVFVVGTPIEPFQMRGGGAVGDQAWAGTNLPTGLRLQGDSGVVSGTPSRQGIFNSEFALQIGAMTGRFTQRFTITGPGGPLAALPAARTIGTRFSLRPFPSGSGSSWSFAGKPLTSSITRSTSARRRRTSEARQRASSSTAISRTAGFAPCGSR
jgi:hypothetical protein